MSAMTRIGPASQWPCAFAGLLAVLLLTSCTTGRLGLDREVLLERGRVADPQALALASTAQGGYIVAGAIGGIPWATRTDAYGKVQWHRDVHLAMPENAGGTKEAEFEGVAMLPDDSAMLCGWRDSGEDPARANLVGLLTRMDRDGNISDQRQVRPLDNPDFRLSYLHRCIAWQDGVAVVGETMLFSSAAAQQYSHKFIWLLFLNGHGRIEWQKLIPTTFDAATAQLLVTPKQDLLLAGNSQLLRLSRSGEIKEQRDLNGWLVRPTTADTALHFLVTRPDHTLELHTLGEQLEDVAPVVAGTAPVLQSLDSRNGIVYVLPNHTFALFGHQPGNVMKAGFASVSADLRQMQTYIFDSYGNSIWVNDALPTGRPGEFITIRPFLPRGKTFSDSDTKNTIISKRYGMVMSFVRIKLEEERK